jgi:hypothetical protein
MAPSPALAQLRLDLAALQIPTGASGAAMAGAALTPQAFANLSAIAQAPGAALAPAAGPVATSGAAAPTDALQRVMLAQQVLGKLEPGAFAKLPQDGQEAALNALWDNWKAKGLVGDDSAPRAFDALVIQGVDDRALTAANKSIFLGVGVLGYPLEDALWLSRTRIGDALDENQLHYPSDQRWRDASGTPEFLSTTPEGQALVDAWGRAVEHGRRVIAQVEAGSTELPASAEIAPAAAAGFARLVAELRRRGDAEALRYLRDEDPTFVAFLLDARKPGYYLYNGDKSVVARIMATDAAHALGIRRVEHGDAGAVVRSLYYYRPERVAERLSAVAAQPASADAAPTRELLATYAPRLASAARVLPAVAADAKGYSFVEPQFLAVAALDSRENQLATYGKQAASSQRYELPIDAKTVRALRAEGRRYGALEQARWDALLALYDACPALAAAAPETALNVVSQPYQSGGRLIAPVKAPGRGAVLQLFLLDRLVALGKSDAKARDALLRFAAKGVEAALAR